MPAQGVEAGNGEGSHHSQCQTGGPREKFTALLEKIRDALPGGRKTGAAH